MNLPSSFGGQMVLFAICCVLAYLAWPTVRGMFPDSFPLEQRAGRERFDEYGYTSDPGRFDRWRNAQGGTREYSPHFPGPRTLRPSGAPGTILGMRLDPDEQSPNIEDRRGERGGPPWQVDPSPQWDSGPVASARGLACRDNRTGRDVPLSFCERSGAPPPGGR